MKISFSLVSFLALVWGTSAFVPALSPAAALRNSALYSLPNPEDPVLQAAIAEVRAAASEFSDETVHFANRWVDNMLEGKMNGLAAGLLDECVLDDSEKCQRYSKALTELDLLLGVGATEQY